MNSGDKENIKETKKDWVKEFERSGPPYVLGTIDQKQLGEKNERKRVCNAILLTCLDRRRWVISGKNERTIVLMQFCWLVWI